MLLMAIPNLIALIYLTPVVIAETNTYMNYLKLKKEDSYAINI